MLYLLRKRRGILHFEEKLLKIFIVTFLFRVALLVIIAKYSFPIRMSFVVSNILEMCMNKIAL